MKGIVNRALNEREAPNLNARITRFYDEGDTVTIVAPFVGDNFEGDDSWYQLSNGNFVWSVAVDTDADCKEVTPQDRIQWLMSFREIDELGKPKLLAQEPAKRLSFVPVQLPADGAGIRLNPVAHDIFVNGFMQTLEGLPARQDQVFVYIHGFQLTLFSSLKLDLLNHFAQNYMTHPDNRIAKVIYLVWPSQGGSKRKEVDDRSVEAGELFTARGFFEVFEKLSAALAAKGKSLNLLVHSFGHQLLNGMINPVKPAGGKIFKNIFLMAPDVTLFALKEGGVKLKNNFHKAGGKDTIDYNFSALKEIAHNVHVFHDKYDFLLYASTKKFVGEKRIDNEADKMRRQEMSSEYRNIGNYNENEIPDLQPGFHFYEVTALLNGQMPENTKEFPFRAQNLAATTAIDKVHSDFDYTDIYSGQIIDNLRQFPNYHRYLFTCRPIVNKIQSLL